MKKGKMPYFLRMIFMTFVFINLKINIMNIQAQISEDKKTINYQGEIFRKPEKRGRRFWGHGYNNKNQCRYFIFWIGVGDGNCEKCNFG